MKRRAAVGGEELHPKSASFYQRYSFQLRGGQRANERARDERTCPFSLILSRGRALPYNEFPRVRGKS